MNELDGFTMDGSRGLYRPVGVVSLDEAVARVRAAITAARAHHAEDLLVDSTGLTGFNAPDTLQRFMAGSAFAEEANGCVRLAIVARAEMIDPQKFGSTVAANRGLAYEIFTTEAAARNWLDAKRRHGTK